MSSQLGRRALQRSLGAPATPAPTPATARAARRIPCVASSQARWMASEKGKGPRANEPSFKGQMLESITQRIAREKEDLRRSALEREARGRGGALPITICEYYPTPPSSSPARWPLTSRPHQSSSARASSPSTAASTTRATSTRHRHCPWARSRSRPGTTRRPRSWRRRGPTSWPSWARRTCRRWTR